MMLEILATTPFSHRHTVTFDSGHTSTRPTSTASLYKKSFDLTRQERDELIHFVDQAIKRPFRCKSLADNLTHVVAFESVPSVERHSFGEQHESFQLLVTLKKVGWYFHREPKRNAGKPLSAWVYT
jgi:hypothetical protein